MANNAKTSELYEAVKKTLAAKNEGMAIGDLVDTIKKQGCAVEHDKRAIMRILTYKYKAK